MSRGARDFSGFSKSEKSNQKRMSPEENPLTRGDNCNSLKEPIPKFIPAPCETIFEGSNNSYIILGRDRPNSLSSGYGGKGNTQAGSIDIVFGRMGNTRAGPTILTPSAFMPIPEVPSSWVSPTKPKFESISVFWLR